MKHLFILALIAIFASVTAANAQSIQNNAVALATANSAILSSANDNLLALQEAEIKKQTESLQLLRQLYSEGLIAKLELDNAEASLKLANDKLEQTQNQIKLNAALAEETRRSAELTKTKSLVKPTLMPLNVSKTATVIRSAAGSWSISNLSQVQQFFSRTFGRPLPTSTVGQSATHNRMGWDHRNSVDVGLHPDSPEGQALIGYLQSSGIPFLAFRSAIPGVATGPHIHIGFPSHRIS